MKDRNQRTLEELVEDPRADAEGLTTDDDVADIFDDEQHRSGGQDGLRKRRIELDGETGYDRDVLAGDGEGGILDLIDAETVGEETIGTGSALPGQDVVDEIGRAVGIEYQDNEPLHTTEKLEDRDRNRWELNPASSEDFRERRKTV